VKTKRLIKKCLTILLAAVLLITLGVPSAFAGDRAGTVDDLSDPIEEIGDPVTLADKEAIDAARAAYNALTEEQKALVSPSWQAKLKAAEEAYEELLKEQVKRIAGDNRYDTSAKTALDAYPEGSETVIIARGDDEGDFADALAASYLAGVKQAPILLSSPGSLSAEVKSAIQTLGAKNAIVLGGARAVFVNVETELKALGLAVKRLSGASRYDVAAKIAAEGGNAQTAIVVSGYAPADSLTAGPLAFSERYPLLLVDRNSVPAATKKAIADLGINKIIVIGGENAVSKGVYDELNARDRYAGHSRIETSLAVAEKCFAEAKGFSIVGYLKLADAVGAAVSGNPIIYVRNDLSGVGDYLTEATAADTRFTIFGGVLGVNNKVENELKKLHPPGDTKFHTVTFKDGHTVLKAQQVEHGKAATAPNDDPAKTGYIFAGWDKAFDNITSDLTVNAKWMIIDAPNLDPQLEQLLLEDFRVYYGPPQDPFDDYAIGKYYGNYSGCEVVFMGGICVDAMETYIEIADYTFGFPGNPPLLFVYNNHTFLPIKEAYEAGWITKKDVGDIWVKHPKYPPSDPKIHTVTFKDGHTVLKAQLVEHGKAATAPNDDPVKTGYIFNGWDKAFDNITGNLTVNAKWIIDIDPELEQRLLEDFRAYYSAPRVKDKDLKK